MLQGANGSCNSSSRRQVPPTSASASQTPPAEGGVSRISWPTIRYGKADYGDDDNPDKVAIHIALRAHPSSHSLISLSCANVWLQTGC